MANNLTAEEKAALVEEYNEAMRKLKEDTAKRKQEERQKIIDSLSYGEVLSVLAIQLYGTQPKPGEMSNGELIGLVASRLNQKEKQTTKSENLESIYSM